MLPPPVPEEQWFRRLRESQRQNTTSVILARHHGDRLQLSRPPDFDPRFLKEPLPSWESICSSYPWRPILIAFYSVVTRGAFLWRLFLLCWARSRHRPATGFRASGVIVEASNRDFLLPAHKPLSFPSQNLVIVCIMGYETNLAWLQNLPEIFWG